MIRSAIAGVAVLASYPMLCFAQPVSGPYVSLGAGVGLQQDEVALADPSIGRTVNNFWSFKPGFSGEVSAGYGFGNGFRAELEGDFLTNGVDRYSPTPNVHIAHGTERKYGGMADVLYDFSFGLPIFPYLGVGIGGQAVTQAGFSQAALGFAFPANAGSPGTHSVGAFAYQAIVGAAVPIGAVPGLSLTAEYRFLGLADPYPTFPRTTFFPNGTSTTGRVRFSNDYNHSILVGLRYALFAPPAASPPTPQTMAPAPAPEAARTYLVFFDWDRADLNDRARQIIREAAQNATHVKLTRIEVNGYTDLSGTAAYNAGLSLRRARAVAAELTRDGVAQSSIDIHGYGETHPLVPTAAGVREPQNRRVEILFR